MINLKKHRQIMFRVLRKIYGDPVLRQALGFKGGTAAMFFYQLPRMSVDLDFDLLDSSQEGLVFARLKKILTPLGELRDARQKYYTLFFLLRYQKYQRNLKVEVSRRKTSAEFQVKDYLGLSMRVMTQDDMAACKLAALLTRRVQAARDFFDVWYFLEKDWPLDEEVLEEKTGLSVRQVWQKALVATRELETQKLLHGLGELVDEGQKQWLRDEFKTELELLLRMRLEGGG